MKRTLVLLYFAINSFLFYSTANAQPIHQSQLIRGFCISVPTHSEMNNFIKYINTLGATGVNTLILRVDYNFAFAKHPELQHLDVFQKSDAELVYQSCKKQGIKIVPLINLYGHQSWGSKPAKLLEVYPQFDETPDIKLPQNYIWPNSDSLYCKSYCPLHPGIHKIIFDLIDEVMDAFHADAFHAGMDEITYIGHKDCKRCHKKNRVILLADEIKKIHDHVTARKARMWMWGDRLIDGKTSGIDFWESSHNGTAPAINLIPKDIVICDWHYDRAEPTAIYFAMKGFDVVACSWKDPDVGVRQFNFLETVRKNASYPIGTHLLGMCQTIWTQTNIFLDENLQPRPNADAEQNSFKKLSEIW